MKIDGQMASEGEIAALLRSFDYSKPLVDVSCLSAERLDDLLVATFSGPNVYIDMGFNFTSDGIQPAKEIHVTLDHWNSFWFSPDDVPDDLGDQLFSLTTRLLEVTMLHLL